MRLQQSWGRHHRLDRRHLLAQVLPLRFLVTGWGMIGRAVITIEEGFRALDVLEHAQIVIIVFPHVGDKETNGIGLGHGRESRTSVSGAKPEVRRRLATILPE